MSAKENQTALWIRRIYSASREKVFHAWTDPQALKRWFVPADSYATAMAEVDLRVGGRYTIEMKTPDGEHHRVSGVYREIVPPERLVFTWAWAATKEEESLVTVELRTRENGTELTLKHEGLTDQMTRDKHEHGWGGCLDRLDELLAAA